MAGPLMTFHIRIDKNGITRMRSDHGSVTMIPFSGSTDSKLFRGKVMPGACDVQVTNAAGVKHMCAKYMFKGTDCEGNSCFLYVENNGWFTGNETGDVFHACPQFMTDSPVLFEKLCRPVFRSEGHPSADGVDILIFRTDGETDDCYEEEASVPDEIPEILKGVQPDMAVCAEILDLMERPFKQLVYYTGSERQAVRISGPDTETVCAAASRLRGTNDILLLLREDEALAALTYVAGKIRNIENDSLAILEAVLEEGGKGPGFAKRASSMRRIRIKPV